MRELLITSSALIAALLLLRALFRKRLSARVQYALWALVLARLLVPVNLPASRFSVLSNVQVIEKEIRVERQVTALSPAASPGTALAPIVPGNTPADGMSERSDTVQTPAQLVAPDAAGTQASLLRVLWLGGTVIVGAYFLYANLRFYLLLRKRRTPYPVEYFDRPVWLVEEGLSSPCLFGGAVYLTPAALASEGSLCHVLTHEDTHAMHLDPLWSLLRCVCLTVYWFDPLVWVAAIASKTDCELACDEGALQRLGESERIGYGETLLSLVPVKKGPGTPFLVSTTMTAGKKQLKDRLTRIIKRPRRMIALTLAVAVLAGLLAACAFAGSVEKDQPQEKPEPTEAQRPVQSDAPDISELVFPSEADRARYFFAEGCFLGSWDNGTWHSAGQGGFTVGQLFNRGYIDLWGDSVGAVRFYAAEGPGGFDDPDAAQRLLAPFGIIEGGSFVMALPGSITGEAAMLDVPDYGFYASFDGQSHYLISNAPMTALPLVEPMYSTVSDEVLVELLDESGISNASDVRRFWRNAYTCDVDGDGEDETLVFLRNNVDADGDLVLREGDDIFYILLLADGDTISVVTLECMDYTDDPTAHFTPGLPIIADLDGDGMCEIILQYRGWEWGHYSVFDLADNQWTEVLRAENGT